jgi:predicted nucleic acid-binding protein
MAPTSLDPTKTYLFDSCVLISYYRGDQAVKQLVDEVVRGPSGAGISILTDFELWAGVKNNRDAKQHKILLAKFRRYHLNVTIARRAGALKHLIPAAGVPDLLIAATAEYYGIDIVTKNVKHFTNLPLEAVGIITY